MAIQTTSLWGMIICRIEENGNLLSRWNNNLAPVNELHFEIARKNAGSPNTVTGTYSATWIEHTGDVVQGTLEITGNNTSITEWTWSTRNTVSFRGTGMQIGMNEIAVIYWDENALPTLL